MKIRSKDSHMREHVLFIFLCLDYFSQYNFSSSYLSLCLGKFLQSFCLKYVLYLWLGVPLFLCQSFKDLVFSMVDHSSCIFHSWVLKLCFYWMIQFLYLVLKFCLPLIWSLLLVRLSLEFCIKYWILNFQFYLNLLFLEYIYCFTKFIFLCWIILIIYLFSHLCFLEFQ